MRAKIAPYPTRAAKTRSRRWLASFGAGRSEAIAVAALLALGGGLRLWLALRGWPSPNSDESTLGLMALDILRHGAHPAFTYGEHHVGSLDAYLQVPLFALLGPTRLALHLTTTIQFLAFLLVFYFYVRTVFSRLVALASLALLALGAELELYFTLRAGHYAQDMLLLGALLLALPVVRLRGVAGSWRGTALDVGLGLVAGLALWSTVLLVPFVCAAGLALAVEALRRWRDRDRRTRARLALRRGAPVTLGALVGMAPLLVVTATTHGAILIEALRAAGAAGGSQAPPGPLGTVASLAQQAAGTLLFGLPSLLGSRSACMGCLVWPSPLTTPTLAQALPIVLIGGAYSAIFLWGWWSAASALAREAAPSVRRTFAHWRGVRLPWPTSGEHGAGRLKAAARGVSPQSLPAQAGTVSDSPGSSPEIGSDAGDDAGASIEPQEIARRWGRAMLVLASGSALLLYIASRASYVNVDTAPRYITDLYLALPLLLDPLCRAARRLWRWLALWRDRIGMAPFPGWGPLLAGGALLALVTVNGAGAWNALRETSNREVYGVPAGQRDMRLLAFLRARGASDFYTSWWVCYRLMFDSAERATCYVVSDSDAFAPGSFNRVPAYAARVRAAAHPAYVFDLTTSEVAPNVPAQVAARIAAHDPRFAGYASAMVGGYVVFYFASTVSG